MDTILGLIGLVLYIVFVLGLAAAITLAVIKISPTKTTPDSAKDTAS
jgi:hypothetical protein